MVRRTTLLLLLGLLWLGHASAQIHFTATLNGAQQNPPVVTNGSGTGSFTLSDDLSELKFVIAYQGLSANYTGGHFHTGKSGVNGAVVREFPAAGSLPAGIAQGSWKSTDLVEPLTPALVESLLTGRIYVNLHTSTNQGGELRGQLNAATSLMYIENLTPVAGSPAPNAGGTGVYVLSPARDQIKYWITYRGLSGILSNAGAHLHTGADGVSGAVQRTISQGNAPASSTLSGVWSASDGSQPLTGALVDSLVAGHMYANFHTAAKPGGELRGQLVLSTGIGFAVALDNLQETTPTTSTGTGTAWVSFNGTRTALKYGLTYINLSDTLSAGGHFHTGIVGRTGPVVRSIGTHGDLASATDSGSWNVGDLIQPLTTALAESLLTGRAYMNFHTKNNPGGEIRGQVNLATGIGFTIRMNSSQESSPNATTGQATGSFVLAPDRSSANYSITYFGLSDSLTAGHFHSGQPGISGPVVKNIATSVGPASATLAGTWASSDITQPLTGTLTDVLIAGGLYSNFHTKSFPGGEIRGQLSYDGDVVLTGVQEGSTRSQIPGSFRLEQNYPNPFNPTTKINYQLSTASSVQLVVYDVLGRESVVLVNEVKAPGQYAVQFDGKRLASGVYFYRLTAGSFVETKRMVLIK